MRLETRVLSTSQIKYRFDTGCPIHGGILKDVTRLIRDEDGELKYGGSYFGCHLGYTKCKYALGIGDKHSRPHEKILDGEVIPPEPTESERVIHISVPFVSQAKKRNEKEIMYESAKNLKERFLVNKGKK